MAVTLTVSIPSTLASREGWCDLPTPEDKQIRRLLETGLPQATCPQCGHRATVEEVTVHRPGQTSVLRRVLRCWRQVPLGAGSHSAKGARCPVQVISEAPIDQDLPAVELHIELGNRPATRPCEQCGTDILDIHGRRFCRPCYQDRERERIRQHNAVANEARKHPCPECGQPCLGQRCRACHHVSRVLPDCAPPPLEAPEGPRSCLDCGRNISDRNARARRCIDCAWDYDRRTERDRKRRIREAKRAAERQGQDLPPESPQEAFEHTTLPEPPPYQTEELQEHPGPKEEHEEETSMEAPTPTRTCAECGASIEHRKKIAVYCEGCSTERARMSARESYRIQQASRRREREAASVTAPVLAPPSRALRLSVVDLACRVDGLDRLGKELVSDVLSLSPERLALLRSVLADAEEVCA